ncbi:autoinducer binding domain-containing protein [Sphingomonas daechungensis]|uniref:Autoinducer binding domain-containing protein n=1 Tax=Sphingomonas daechungensis TaxID=1176646 RepID=A0ABX6SY38_9SPHN|nr:autoinducer binding domain-containing protein [Sphingomonas daechungensis]QNP42385.1 autoinducer binding domain-containing protein [Sphingomonas daechungensis]
MAQPAHGGIIRTSRHAGFEAVQEFATAVASISDMTALRDAVSQTTRQLGFDYFAIVHHIRFGRPSNDKVRLSDYPIEWLAKIREDEAFREPVLRAAERASSGFLWSDLDRHVPLGARERAYMLGAARHGLAEGYTVPNHVPGETFGSCHFAVRRRESLPVRNLPAAQALGCFSFEAARQILLRDTRSSEEYVVPAPLTDRQRDCVLFAARGKSDSVIAELLSIRPKTVNEHMEAAKRRYSVATRTQLIVRALFQSEICFSEVID